MKLWRKLGKKERQEDGSVVRTGRMIKQSFQLQEYALKRAAKTTPLLDKLFARGDIKFVMTKAEIEAFYRMTAAAANGEATDETK
jgi:hypothetical protein